MSLLDPNWTAVSIAGLVMLGGTAINLFIIGRFVGQWSEAMKNMSSALGRVEAQVLEVSDLSDGNASKLQLMDQRLLVVESATSRFWEMREQFVTLRVTIEMTAKRSDEVAASTGRAIAGIERQLANLVVTRTKSGLTQLSTDKESS